jgi:predicted HAD superfamily Cof-like phosphohydrolase
MKSSYYWDGNNLPQFLTTFEHAPHIQNRDALTASVMEGVFETMRVSGITISHEFRDVYDFHRKFELMASVTPRHLTKRKLKERVEFMLEELQEFASACGLYIGAGETGFTQVGVYDLNEMADEPVDQDLGDQADALVDLVYVALGSAVMLGLPWDALWSDVQRANMTKVRGITHRGHAVDVKKPEGWQPPKTEEILKAAGYDRRGWSHNQEQKSSIDDSMCADDVEEANHEDV